MLNISPNSISKNIENNKYKSLFDVHKRSSGNVLIKLLTALFLVALIIMFLPWTQNIQSRGIITTLKPDQRPQTIHSVIAGRIEKWYVQEGDIVNKGDTIIFISETKDEFFDPDLLIRTQEQLESKKLSVSSYEQKVKALDVRKEALVETGKLKLDQAINKLKQSRLKVTTDSIDFEARALQFEIAKEQLRRTEQLFESGLKSLTDFENRKLTLQEAQAKMISAENQLLSSQNDVINAQIELTSVKSQFNSEIAKTESEKFTALSNMYDAEAAVTKKRNEFMNYSIRQGLYYITAPQDGIITQTILPGIGETIKEGEEIVSIMPANYDLAVEMYVRPIDLPLLKKGQSVRIQFDGWPAIVFSGWPNTSYGTYGGQVFAIDNFISKNGKYRILVAPDPSDHPWPEALRVGSGTNNMVLLKDVSIWYELWRQINGFPPDFYN